MDWIEIGIQEVKKNIEEKEVKTPVEVFNLILDEFKNRPIEFYFYLASAALIPQFTKFILNKDIKIYFDVVLLTTITSVIFREVI